MNAKDIRKLNDTELEAFIASLQSKITYKVSQQGGLSAYGLQRNPVTLYPAQWERIDSDSERKARADFLAANKAEFDRIAADKAANPQKYKDMAAEAKRKAAAKA
jgi:hypothetical protein